MKESNVLSSAERGGGWSARRVNRSATQLFLYCFLGYACSYIGRKNLSACVPAMIEEGLLTKIDAGTVTTVYMICYGLGQLVSGVLATKIKPKYMIGIGLGGAGLCNLAMGLVPSSLWMPLIWGCNGIFHSMLWAPIIRCFTDLLPHDRSVRAGTNIAVSAPVGTVLAFLIPGIVLKFASWRSVFYIAGGMLLVACLIWVLGNVFLKDYVRMMEERCYAERAELRDERPVLRAEQDDREPSAGKHPRRSARPSLITVWIASGLWMILFGLFCNGALRDAVEVWAPTFLAEQFKLDSFMAALISVIIPVVSTAGTYVAHWLHTRLIRNELYTAGIMFGVAIACICGLLLSMHVSAWVSVCLIAVSVSAMWGANHMFLTVIPYHFARYGMSAAVTGFLNSVIYFSTALCSWFYGFLASRIDWTFLTVVWLAVGVVGVLACGVCGFFWARKSARLDEGILRTDEKK